MDELNETYIEKVPEMKKIVKEKVSDVPMTTAPIIKDVFPEKNNSNTTFVVNETTKACSYEFGKAGSRHKVYYETKEELESLVRQALEIDQLRAKLENAVVIQSE